MTSAFAPARERATYLHRCVHARVVQTKPITPNLKRITIAAEELREFPWHGPDQWFRLFLPRDGQQRPVLPTRADDWWPQIVAMPDEIRPWVRNYTVRYLRPELGEIDFDVVLHGTTGPASRWARGATTGDWIGLLDQTAPYDPPAGTRWQLLVGDETAVPAISSIVENLRSGTDAQALIEVPTAADRLDLSVPEGVRVTWLPRDSEDVDVGSLVIDAVQSATLGEARDGYAWVAGESGLIRRVRRHLVNQRGMAKSAVYFCGYWRRGVSYAD
ncbi:MAG TPA: siderophore-interacting protein [Nocardioidaceae bacterium]|nr:siderophore-interacting protein [Nocardioidaceae bacterium]